MLESADTDSRGIAERLLAVDLEPELVDLIESLLAVIDMYDFDGALAAMEEIEHKLLDLKT